MKACCDDGYATQILANFACKDGGFCHFEPFAKSNLAYHIELFFIVILRECEISTEFRTHFLNLWILRLKPQYDKFLLLLEFLVVKCYFLRLRYANSCKFRLQGQLNKPCAPFNRSLRRREREFSKSHLLCRVDEGKEFFSCFFVF